MLFLTWPFKSSTLALKSFLFTMLILSVNSGFSQQIDFWNRYPYSCLLPGDRLVLDSLSICLLLVFDIIQFSKYSFTQSFSRWLCHCSFRPQSHTSVCSFVLIRVPRHQEKSCVKIISPILYPRRWWRIRDSNPWPPACKAGALPTELYPHGNLAATCSPIPSPV